MSDAEVIANERERFITAFNETDIETMSQVAAADLIGMPPNEAPVVGIEASRTWWQQGFDAGTSVFKATQQELEIRDDRAMDRFTWTMDFTPTGGGDTAHDQGTCVWLWRREADGTWKIARAIWNSDNPMPGQWSGGSAG